MADNNDLMNLSFSTDEDPTNELPVTSSTEDLDSQNPNSTKTGASLRRYECEVCLYKTTKEEALELHQLTMHNNTLQCCARIFTNKEDLISHVKLTHKFGFSCLRCNQTYYRKALLNRHYNIHENDRDYLCRLCPYITNSKFRFLRHQRSHRGNLPGMAEEDSELDSELDSSSEEDEQFLTLAHLKEYF